MSETLVSRDSKGKIRVVEISYEWDEEQHGFVIHRVTGLLNGKMTIQPDILIQRGKASRTLKAQVELEYASNKKKYLDKGYKLLNKELSKYTDVELNDLLGEVRTSQDGVPKPQLAKQADKVTNKKTFDKEYYGSRKIDGLRVLIYQDAKGELHTASRGATNYDGPMIEILTNPTLIEIFNHNPGLIMDGECYKLGLSLQQINSIARTIKTAKDLEILQFYWYDIVDINATAKERINRINNISKEYNIGWNPEKIFEYGELRIQHVPHIKISGWENMLKLHNDYVEEGWEGLVIRLSDSLYGPNKRTNDWIKIKKYFDNTYKVIGYELGLRGSEDMIFICEMPDGKTFKASPMGDRSVKEEYVNNFEQKYKNKFGDCKYFIISSYGIPQQPKFISFRWDLE